MSEKPEVPQIHQVPVPPSGGAWRWENGEFVPDEPAAAPAPAELPAAAEVVEEVAAAGRSKTRKSTPTG